MGTGSTLAQIGSTLVRSDSIAEVDISYQIESLIKKPVESS